MKVVKDEQTKARQIAEPGDIVEWNDGSFNIVTEREVHGNAGLNGVGLNGIEWECDIQAQVNNGNVRLYKASEYELVLRRKEGK